MLKIKVKISETKYRSFYKTLNFLNFNYKESIEYISERPFGMKIYLNLPKEISSRTLNMVPKISKIILIQYNLDNWKLITVLKVL